MANKKRASRRSKPNKKASLPVPSSAGVEIFTPPSTSPPRSERVSHTPAGNWAQSQFHLRYTNQSTTHPCDMSAAEMQQVFEEVGIDTSPGKLRRLRRIPGLGLPFPPPRLPPKPTAAMKRESLYAKVDALCDSLAEFCTVPDEVDTRVGIAMAEDEDISGSESILLKQAELANGTLDLTTANAKTQDELDEEQRIEDIYLQIKTDDNLSSSGTLYKSLERAFTTTALQRDATAPSERITAEQGIDGTYPEASFGARDDHLKTFYRDPACTADDVLENFKVSLLRMAHLQGSTDAAVALLKKRNGEIELAIEELRAMNRRVSGILGDNEDEGDESL